MYVFSIIYYLLYFQIMPYKTSKQQLQQKQVV